MLQKVLIKGAGEQASAVAHRLFRCGFRVVMTEVENPRAIRRRVSFCAAVFREDGRFEVEGVAARSYVLDEAEFLFGFDWDHIPIFVDPSCQLRHIWHPDVIVDGRILKRNLDTAIDDAPVTIALGPGFEAGSDVDYVIETNRGHALGRIIHRGFSEADTSEPGPVCGYTTQRVLRAPTSGVLDTDLEIGVSIRAGETVAHVSGEPVPAEIDGILRGLIYPGSFVSVNEKIGDIDPRGDPSFCDRISDKARNISGGVLEAILSHARQPEST